MIKFIRFFYRLSLPVFLALLLYVYAILPDEPIGIYLGSGGLALLSWSKSDFFYALLGLFLFTNGIILLHRWLTRGQVDTNLSSYAHLAAHEVMYHWLNGLSLVFNLIYILSLMLVGMYYNSQLLSPHPYVLWLYLCLLLLVGWVFFLLYLRLTKRRR